MRVRAEFAELAFWLAVALVAIASVVGFVLIARGPLGDRAPSVRNLASAL